jgi:hypothetical protein
MTSGNIQPMTRNCPAIVDLKVPEIPLSGSLIGDSSGSMEQTAGGSDTDQSEKELNPSNPLFVGQVEADRAGRGDSSVGVQPTRHKLEYGRFIPVEARIQGR